MIPTPTADRIIQGFSFKDESGKPIDFAPGQREVMECILNRAAPDGRKRLHIMTHTRYGKSASVGAAVAVRASVKPEKWAIVAGTKEKARIIMDYIINYVLDDPILSSQLNIEIPLERLRRERSRDRITFSRRGEIRVYSADSKNRQELGNSLMGFGAPNVVEDESALIDDDVHSKVMRMLGDNSADNFLVKIGNPFRRNHFLKSYESDRYYKIDIDYLRGMQEGRLTEDFIEEMREQSNFDIFYECKFPPADAIDEKGWVPLITEEEIRRAFVSDAPQFGSLTMGCDIAGGGRNWSVGVVRSANAARITLKEKEPNTLVFAGRIKLNSQDLGVLGGSVFVDKVGIGRGCAELLQSQIGAVGVNAGDKPSDEDQFVNLRAEMYWRARDWIMRGGRLIVSNPQDEDDWLQLAKIKYRTVLEGRRGKLQIISKEELLRHGIESPDIADALSLTFYRAEVTPGADGGVVEPQSEEFDPFSMLPA